MSQDWNPRNRAGRVYRTWQADVLVAALGLEEEFRAGDLAVGSPYRTAEALLTLWQKGLLDRAAGAAGTYRLTAAGRLHAGRLRSGESPWLGRG